LQTLAQTPDLEIADRISDPTFIKVVGIEIPDLEVYVDKASGAKCVRCWFTYPSVGEDARHPQVCARCRRVLAG